MSFPLHRTVPSSSSDARSGDDGIERPQGDARFFLAAKAYGVICLALLAGAWLGILDAGGVGVTIAWVVAGHVAVFIGLRRQQRLLATSAVRRAPPGVDVHVLLGMALLILAAVRLEPIRSASLQLLFVLVCFDVHRLSRKALTATAVLGCVALAVQVAFGWWTTSGGELSLAQLSEVAMFPIYLSVLVVIGHQVRTIHLRQLRQRLMLADALGQLKAMSDHDGLTGALNRRRGAELLQQERARMLRGGRPFSVAMLDIDHFKQVNDVHGHACGDQVLIETARLARALVTSPAAFVRWGGEEFLVLLPDTGLHGAVALVERLRQRVAAHDWSEVAPGLRVDFSAGVCEHRDGCSIDDTVARADAGLYAAKTRGRGRVVAQPDGPC